MNVSVMIVTLNRPQDLIVALDSLVRQTHVPKEVLVIDQSDDDKTHSAVLAIQAKYPAHAGMFHYFHLEEKSAVKARNFGMKRATADIVSFLDDDSELCGDYYEKILTYFSKNPSLGGLGGSLIRKDMLSGNKGVLRRFLWKIFLLNPGNGCMTLSGFGYPIYEKPVTKTTRVEMLHGCNMNFRQSVMGKELFDEWFTGYSFREDAEFCYRLSKITEIWVVPDARLYHHESPNNRLDIEKLKKMEIRNYRYVFEKHKKKGWWSWVFFFYSIGGILCIDFLEFLLSGDARKFKKFRAGIQAAFAPQES